jgi:hypothetical protein
MPPWSKRKERGSGGGLGVAEARGLKEKPEFG